MCPLAGGPVPLPRGRAPAVPVSLQLRDLQEKYAECGGMLQEAREEVKSLRNRSLPNSTVSRYSDASLLPVVSGDRAAREGSQLPPVPTLPSLALTLPPSTDTAYPNTDTAPPVPTPPILSPGLAGG